MNRWDSREGTEGHIREVLAAALMRDCRLASTLIRVEIRGLLVTLSGTVPTRDAALAAINIAARTPRLRGIINRIQVDSPLV
jgi:osmotically-inducible protein OsmY